MILSMLWLLDFISVLAFVESSIQRTGAKPKTNDCLNVGQQIRNVSGSSQGINSGFERSNASFPSELYGRPEPANTRGRIFEVGFRLWSKFSFINHALLLRYQAHLRPLQITL